nr:hypothetical protein Q903MT_gene394 [Picea sitchensis]
MEKGVILSYSSSPGSGGRYYTKWQSLVELIYDMPLMTRVLMSIDRGELEKRRDMPSLYACSFVNRPLALI